MNIYVSFQLTVPHRFHHLEDYTILTEDDLCYLPFYKSFESTFDSEIQKSDLKSTQTSLHKQNIFPHRRPSNRPDKNPTESGKSRKRKRSENHTGLTKKGSLEVNEKTNISTSINHRFDYNSNYVQKLVFYEDSDSEDVFINAQSKGVMMPVIHELDEVSFITDELNDCEVENCLCPFAVQKIY